MARTRGAAKLSDKRRQDAAEAKGKGKRKKESKTHAEAKPADAAPKKTKKKDGTTAAGKSKKRGGKASKVAVKAAVEAAVDVSKSDDSRSNDADDMDVSETLKEPTSDANGGDDSSIAATSVKSVLKPDTEKYETVAAQSRNTLNKKPAEWGGIVVGGRSTTLPHRDVPKLPPSKYFSEGTGNEDTDAVIGTLAGGRPVSGRWWKPVAAQKASAMVNKPKKQKRQAGWMKRRGKEREIKEAIAMQNELKQLASEKKQAERERSEARRKLREENEKKSQVVQKITDTRKLKKMNRKQLRAIEKR